MSEISDWEIQQLKKLVASMLRKAGPITITSEALNKSDGEFRTENDGYGLQTGFKYYVTK